MGEYSRVIRPIGNSEARAGELVRLAGVLGEEALPLLMDAFEDPYPPLRHKAAGLLAEGLNPQWEEAIISRMASSNADVRTACCLALNGRGTSAAAAALLLALHDEASDVRYHALVSLHAYNHPQERAEVERILANETDPAILVVACQIAAERGWPLVDAICQVRERLRKEDRFQASFALARLSREHQFALESSLRLDIIGEFVGFLKNEATSRAAAQGLVLLEATQATSALTKIARGWLVHPIIRVDAAISLYMLGDPQGLILWKKALESPRKDARGWALTRAGELQVLELRRMVDTTAVSGDYHADTALIALSKYDDEDAWRTIETVARSSKEEEVRLLAETLIRGRRHAV